MLYVSFLEYVDTIFILRKSFSDLSFCQFLKKKKKNFYNQPEKWTSHIVGQTRPLQKSKTWKREEKENDTQPNIIFERVNKNHWAMKILPNYTNEKIISKVYDKTCGDKDDKRKREKHMTNLTNHIKICANGRFHSEEENMFGCYRDSLVKRDISSKTWFPDTWDIA